MKQKSKYLVLKLCLTAVTMFAFGFALVPLYDVFCDVTGLNGKTNARAYQIQSAVIDKTREIKIQFIARNNDNMHWQFKPMEKVLRVHPGESTLTKFYARNPSQHNMVAQAIPSVSPGRAAAYFHKTACFCFERQPLEAMKDTEMPLVFTVDKDLPKDIHTITLAYTLFDVTNQTSIKTAKNGY